MPVSKPGSERSVFFGHAAHLSAGDAVGEARLRSAGAAALCGEDLCHCGERERRAESPDVRMLQISRASADQERVQFW
jgi:hypothetical protein